MHDRNMQVKCHPSCSIYIALTFDYYTFKQGSTYKRKASKAERAKETPTLKDLDFLNDHPEVRTW